MKDSRGKVVTFYSYKGGTGRSMAVANVACLLARRADVRRGILMIDWDLEAPGLHWFFRDKKPVDSGSTSFPPHLGLIDLFLELTTIIRETSRINISEEEAEAIVRGIILDKYIIETDIEKVHYIPAGNLGSEYADKLNSLDWRNLFELAPSLIRTFIDALAERFEYVIIDSRTGLNDVSGICTALAPDQLVLVFTPNRQSMIGGIEMAEKAVRYRRQSDDIRPLVVFPLPSRIDASEPTLLEMWRFGDPAHQEDTLGYQRRFEQSLAKLYGLESCDLGNYFDEIQIQHIPRYSYGEEIAARQERGGRLSLARSYAAFADLISRGDLPWTLLPSTESGAVLVAGATPGQVKVQAAKEYLSEDRFRLKLHDLIRGEVRDVLAKASNLTTSGGHNFVDRLHAYEAVTHDLILLQALLGYWADAQQQSLISVGPKQLCDQIEPLGGVTTYLALRWYPACLLLYAGGIAAVAGGKYSNLRALMLLPVKPYMDRGPVRPSLIRSVGEAMLELERADAFKAVTGLETRRTPRSDYLHDLLQTSLEPLLSLGLEYDSSFDRFELLYAMEYAHLYERINASFGPKFWGPIGRFGWKRDSYSELINEAEFQGAEWGPVKAGLFDGSIVRFKIVAEGMQIAIDSLNWW